jgi:hypothetical protein
MNQIEKAFVERMLAGMDKKATILPESKNVNEKEIELMTESIRKKIQRDEKLK